MANAQSNPMSEYDFADLTDDISSEQGEIMHNIAIQRMEPNLLMILNGYQLEKEVLERFAAAGIKYSQLAGLSSEDLTLLGITDNKLQENMLLNFKSLEAQEPYHEGVISAIRNPKSAAVQEVSVIDLLQNQLRSMNLLLTATLLKIGSDKSSQSPGVVVNNSFNSPQAVLDMLEEMTDHTNQMTELIRKMQDEQEMSEKKKALKKKSLKEIAFDSLLVASGIIAGVFLAKILRAYSKA
ncbi:CLUMA_CG005523, isoform A [Clunio marinus]|uniref:CLUMA_CG005523, isoform A n=1 Tax=Clunio marinus TaxID=568069 RepID=A0A1J1HV01_9DIPT|nr:CLUMA_CG005523, isoform A [Clunio marinus]